MEPMGIDQALRHALSEDPRTIYEIAKAIAIEPDSLYRFQQGKDIRLETADRLARALGLQLTPIKRKRSKATK
jgi:predicted transcriptional regulator